MRTQEIVPNGLRKYRAARAIGRVKAIEMKIKNDLIKANPQLAKPEMATVLKNLVKPRLTAALNAQ